MSTYLGKTLLSGVATNTISNAHSLLDFKWTDHILNEMSWLRADTFSWHNGDVYVGAYNHLSADYVSAEGPLTEVVGSYVITYYLAKDKHKIVLPSMESTVQNIYNESGVAWYYILDVTNNRFKLPRTKWGFVGLRDEVGKYVAESLPNITGYIKVNSICKNSSSTSLTDVKKGGAFDKTVGDLLKNGDATTTSASWFVEGNANFDASDSSSTYQENAPVQQRATQMYLYFYVGQFSQSAIEQTAGITSESLNTKADLDGSNVVESAGPDFRNISKWSSNVTNCITEIPQDIKLELDNGTLTLKSGSKVYVPNGFEADGTTPKFDIIITTNDINYTYTTDGIWYIVYEQVSSITGLARCIYPANSGTTQPTASTATLWYDTTNNLVKRYSGSTWDNKSFPIAIITVSNSVITSIDQVFNGFGYIGSTLFALPGVKGLLPNGKNSDGTLKNTEVNITKVCTFTNTSSFTNYRHIVIKDDSISRSLVYYNKFTNFNHDTTAEGVVRDYIPVGSFYAVNGAITFFSIKQSFCTLDYNDSNTISSWSLPSNKYIDLTLGSSGTEYTAPANGYFITDKVSGAADKYMNIINEANGLAIEVNSYSTTNNLKVWLPVKRGDSVKVSYNLSGSTTLFRFIYAEGEI